LNNILREQLREERKQYVKWREDIVRILEIAPDSDLRSLKIRELEQINWAIANFDEALTGAAGKAGAIVSRDVFDMGEAEQGFRARTRRRVQLEATRVQRPEIYNAAPWPIDDFPSGVSIAQAWYGRLPGSYRRVLLDCDKEADNMAFVSAQRTASHGAAWHRAYSDSYGNALPKLLAKALEADEKSDPAA
jgi:hypothetical protein